MKHACFLSVLFYNAIICGVYIASVMDDYGAFAERYWKDKTEVLGEKRISVNTVHQKCHTDYPACMDEKRKAHRTLIESLEVKDYLEGLGVNGRIILK